MSSLGEILNRDFPLLERKRDRLILVVVCLVFSVLFLNIFVPFNINQWIGAKGFAKFIKLSAFGALGAGWLLISQLGLRPLFKIHKFTIKGFLLWFAMETLVLAFLLEYYQGSLSPVSFRFYNDLIFSTLKLALPSIMIPYTLSLLIAGVLYHRDQLKLLQEEVKEDDEQPTLLHFKDERGELRFSIKRSEVLFLESADNYVAVHYLEDGEVRKNLLRNTMKRMETEFEGTTFKRCHRSFIVNISNVKMAQKQGSKYELKLESCDQLIPVSRKFIPDFESILA
ncbi:LytTR family transcriptional regulator [Puteibacter caeruleilacunae]|nr:LytTR family transcriptional regulator [Puteibacter caeruleilacunae]